MSVISSMQPLLDALKTALTPTVASDQQILPDIERQLESVQTQITGLQEEVNLLRRRDETLNFYLARVDDELRLAARLQQDFLPKTLPQVGRVHFHTLYRPAGYVSGDLYDVMQLDEKHVGFYMADAVGHGMPAALLTMFIKNALTTKEFASEGYRLLEPGQAMGILNDVLVRQNLSYATFATAVYGYVEVETLKASFSRSGHPHPVLLRADGSVTDLVADGSLLGIFADEQFQTITVQLETGDRLLIFTDGIEVAFSGDESLNINKWRDLLHERRHLGGEELLHDLSSLLDQETGSLAPKDDLTMIVIDVKPGDQSF